MLKDAVDVEIADEGAPDMGRPLWEEILSIAILTVVAVAASGFLCLYWFTETGFLSHLLGFLGVFPYMWGIVFSLDDYLEYRNAKTLESLLNNRLLLVVAYCSIYYLVWFVLDVELFQFVTLGTGVLVAVGLGVVACLEIAQVCLKIGNRLHKGRIARARLAVLRGRQEGKSSWF